MEKIKILIKGAYGESNFGDDILMLVINNILKTIRNDYKFLLPKSANGYAEKYISQYIYDDIKIETDLIIFGGGTQFYSFKNTRSNISKKILRKIIKNPFTILELIKKKIFKNNSFVNFKSKIGLSIGFGPFEGKHGLKKLKLLQDDLSSFNLLIVRDIDSFLIARSYSINLELGSDLCFVNSHYLPFKIIEKCKKSTNKVSIIIRDWIHTKDVAYIKSIIQFITQNNSFETNIFLFGNDNYCARILEMNRIRYIKWDPINYSVQQFLELVYDAKLVISSRYHGCVLSALHTIPFISISIDPKLSNFSQEIYNAKHDWCFPYSVVELNMMVEEFTVDYMILKSKIEHSVEKNQLQMKLHIEEFSKYLTKI